MNGPGRAQDAALQPRQDTLLIAETATSQALSSLMAVPKGEPLEDRALEDFTAPVGLNAPVGTCQQRGYQGQEGGAGESPAGTVPGTEDDLVPGKRDAFRRGPCRPSGPADHCRSQGWKKESTKLKTSGHKHKNGGHGDRGKENQPLQKVECLFLHAVFNTVTLTIQIYADEMISALHVMG